MVDPLRSGSFGSPGFGPFKPNTSGFGQYLLGGDTADETAYLDKLEAQIAWQNGEMSDDAYLGALSAYVGRLDEGTSEYARAVDELDDTRFSIERNEAVTRVNSAPTPQARIAALIRLQGVDRRRLSGMQPGNEAYREQQGRVEDARMQIRQARWGVIVERFNDGKMTLASMQAAARRFAAESRGDPDQTEYLGHVRDFEDRILGERLTEAMDAFNDKPSRGAAAAVRGIYGQMAGRVDAGSPQGKQIARDRANFDKAAEAHFDALEYEEMQSRQERGTISAAGWLDYLRKRVRDEDAGSIERIRARDTFISESFRMAERTLVQAVEDRTRSPRDLIDFYASSLAVMDLDSERAIEIQQRINGLRSQGLESLSIRDDFTEIASQPFGGHMVGSGRARGRAPRGTPDELFISQHDGSAFASTNCGMASAAMLAWAVTGGKVRVTGGQMRYYSGDREGGTWTDDVVRAMGAVGVGARQVHGMSFTEFRNRISSGKPAVLTGTNAMLPPALRHGYDGDHAIFVGQVMESAGRVWYFVLDPNSQAGYQGQWWPEDAIFAFGWKGHYQGSAVFAGKSGNAKISGPLPPAQTFYSDWNGRSTLGQGGGNSRSEAGPRRDWSEGKPTRERENARRKGDDTSMVADFLGAVDTIADRAKEGGLDRQGVENVLGDADTDKARRARARELLAANDGDPRRAAIEWFTGQRPGVIVAEWSQGDRWYANAVGRRMGYERIRRGDSLEIPNEPTGRAELAADGGPATSPDVAKPIPMEPTGLNPNLEKMAKGVLGRLGLPATLNRIRMVAAWIATENGGEDVEGYNPLRLMTNGVSELPGQIGKLEDGRANFGTLEDGLDATAQIIREQARGLVGALRGDDPEKFVRSLAESGWSGRDDYAGAVTATWNQMPGIETPLIANTGPRVFDTTPPTLAAAVRANPELEELLDVDPNDPVQRAWFKVNVDSAYQAALRGQTSWEYESPSGGEPVTVDFNSAIGRDILAIDYAYTVATTGPTPEGQQARAAALRSLQSLTNDVAMEETKRFIEASTRTREVAMLRQDWTTAHNTWLEMNRALNGVMGLDEDATPDITAATNPALSREDIDYIRTQIERLAPRSSDPTDVEAYAPQGDRLAGLVRDGLMHVEVHTEPATHPLDRAGSTGLATKVTPSAEMLVVQAPDGGIDLVTPDDDPNGYLRPVTQIDANTGQPGDPVPLYLAPDQSPLINIVVDGLDFWVPIQPQEEPLAVLYTRDYTGRDEQLAQRQADALQPPPAPSVAQGIVDNPFGALGDLFDDLLGGAQLMAGPEAAFLGGNGAAAGPAATAGPDIPVAPATQPDPMSSTLRRVGVHDPNQIPMWRITYRDPETDEPVTWLSLDRANWIGWVGQRYGRPAPGLIASGGASFSASSDPAAGGSAILTVNGRPYDGSRPITELLGWYGDPAAGPTTGGPAGTGAPGGDYLFRRVGVLGANGRLEGIAFDGSLTLEERFRTGQIDARAYATRAMPLLVDNITGFAAGAIGRFVGAANQTANLAIATARAAAARSNAPVLQPLTGQGGAWTPSPSPWDVNAQDPRLAAQARVQAQRAAEDRVTATAEARSLMEQARAATEAAQLAAQQRATIRAARQATPTPGPTPRPQPRPQPTPAPRPTPPRPTPAPAPRAPRTPPVPPSEPPPPPRPKQTPPGGITRPPGSF